MAAGFSVFAVPDSHIAYLALHPGLVHAYVEGCRPEGPEAAAFPGDFPDAPLESIVCWGVNWRNVDLYHWILNGGPALTEGGGSIFQTWYEPDHHSAIKLDKHNETFAFDASQVAGLAALVAKVDLAAVAARFGAWSKSKGDHYEPDVQACEPFVDEFKQLMGGLEAAMRQGYGLIWA